MSLCDHVCGVNCRTGGGVGVTSSATQNPIRRVEKPLKKLGHEHQFTVPVETIVIPEVLAMAYEGKTIREYQPATTRVTKLRCSGCSEEVERA